MLFKLVSDIQCILLFLQTIKHKIFQQEHTFLKRKQTYFYGLQDHQIQCFERSLMLLVENYSNKLIRHSRKYIRTHYNTYLNQPNVFKGEVVIINKKSFVYIFFTFTNFFTTFYHMSNILVKHFILISVICSKFYSSAFLTASLVNIRN